MLTNRIENLERELTIARQNIMSASAASTQWVTNWENYRRLPQRDPLEVTPDYLAAIPVDLSMDPRQHDRGDKEITFRVSLEKSPEGMFRVVISHQVTRFKDTGSSGRTDTDSVIDAFHFLSQYFWTWLKIGMPFSSAYQATHDFYHNDFETGFRRWRQRHRSAGTMACAPAMPLTLSGVSETAVWSMPNLNPGVMTWNAAGLLVSEWVPTTRAMMSVTRPDRIFPPEERVRQEGPWEYNSLTGELTRPQTEPTVSTQPEPNTSAEEENMQGEAETDTQVAEFGPVRVLSAVSEPSAATAMVPQEQTVWALNEASTDPLLSLGGHEPIVVATSPTPEDSEQFECSTQQSVMTANTQTMSLSGTTVVVTEITETVATSISETVVGDISLVDINGSVDEDMNLGPELDSVPMVTQERDEELLRMCEVSGSDDDEQH